MAVRWLVYFDLHTEITDNGAAMDLPQFV